MAFMAGSVIGKIFLDTKDWNSGVKQVSSSTKQMQGALTAFSVAAGAAFTASVFKANEFNKAFSNVTTLVDTSVVNVNAMKDSLLALDDRLGSATDLTEGLYQALSASVEPAKAVEFVAESAKFAKAALVDTNTAVDVITTGLNAYGLSADEAGRVSDVLFTTIKRGKTTGAELSSTIGQIIPLASNMNLNFENLGASIATMTRQGVKSAEATTQLQAVMTSLLNPSADLTDAMKAAGYETGEAVTSSDNFQEALKLVIAQTDGSQESLAALFPNVRALRGALALTGEGAQGFTDDLKAMNNASGATEKAFGKQEITFETVANKVEKLAISIGQALLPTVNRVIEVVSGAVNWFLSLDEGVRNIIIGVVAFVAAAGPAIAAIGAINAALAFMAANPVVAAVAGVAALVAGFAALGGIILDVVIKTEKANEALGKQLVLVNKTAKSVDDYRKAFEKAMSIDQQKNVQDVEKSLAALREEKDRLQGQINLIDGKSVQAAENYNTKLSDTAFLFDRVDKSLGTQSTNTNKKIELQDQLNQLIATEQIMEEELNKLKEQANENDAVAYEQRIKQIEEISELNKEWHEKLVQQSGDRIAILELERQKALEEANAIGADTYLIELYYSNERKKIKEEEIIDKKQAEQEFYNKLSEFKQKEIQDERDKIEKIKAINQEWQNKLNQQSMSELEKLEYEKNIAIQNARDIGADTVAIATYYENEKAKIVEKENERIRQSNENLYNQLVATATQALSTLSNVFMSFSNARIEEIQRQLQADLEAAGLAEETEIQRLQREIEEARAAGDFELALQKEKELKRAEMTIEAEQKIAEEKKKAAIFNKVISIVQAGINTAQGITKALADLPPPLSYVMAGITAALGAAQVAAIVATPLPSYAEGGMAGSGLALVGEEGPELVNFGSPAQIFPADITSGLLGGGVNMNNTFIVNSESDAEMITRKLGRRFRSTQRTL